MPSIAFLTDCNGKPKATTTNENQKVSNSFGPTGPRTKRYLDSYF